jgi:hypothetical protein
MVNEQEVTHSAQIAVNLTEKKAQSGAEWAKGRIQHATNIIPQSVVLRRAICHCDERCSHCEGQCR